MKISTLYIGAIVMGIIGFLCSLPSFCAVGCGLAFMGVANAFE